MYRLIRPLEKRILNIAGTIIVTSPNYLQYSEPLSTHKEKCVVIPNVISPNKLQLKNDDKIKQLKAKYGNKPIVFFLGRHVEYKGLK